MARVFVTHKVRNYDDWKKAYDADAERRHGAGLREVGHFHDSNDRNSFLIVWNTEHDAAEATALISGMFSNPELAGLMEQAGVIEKPEFWVA